MIVLLLLASCGNNQVRSVYEEVTYGSPLEVPPDLIRPASGQGLAIPELEDQLVVVPQGQDKCAGEKAPAGGLSVLPKQQNIQMQRDGGQRWLVLQGEPSDLWPWVRKFWLHRGFKLSIEDPVIGVLETEWKQQRDNLPMEGDRVAGQSQLEKKIYAVPNREKYRVRMEHASAPGSTELYLTHRGVELLAQDDMIVWRLRPSDPELEAEMLKNLMIFLGVEQAKASAVPVLQGPRAKRATMIKDAGGNTVLKVDLEFSRLWHRAGLILDRLNFLIEDRNRASGIYGVRVLDPLAATAEERGWWTQLFSPSPKGTQRYQVVLREEGTATHIIIRMKGGMRADNAMAEPILQQMLEQLQ